MGASGTRSLGRDCGGYTLLEVLVAVSVLTAVVGMVSTVTFQILRVQGKWRDEAVATHEIRKAGFWFSRDALNASTTTLADMATSTGITLSWTPAGTTTSRVATYSFSSTSSPKTLLRDLDGATIEAARNVSSVVFSRSGKTVILGLEVDSFSTSTKSRTLRVHMRNLK